MGLIWEDSENGTSLSIMDVLSSTKKYGVFFKVLGCSIRIEACKETPSLRMSTTFGENSEGSK